MKCPYCGSSDIGWEHTDDYDSDWFYCDRCVKSFSRWDLEEGE